MVWIKTKTRWYINVRMRYNYGSKALDRIKSNEISSFLPPLCHLWLENGNFIRFDSIQSFKSVIISHSNINISSSFSLDANHSLFIDKCKSYNFVKCLNSILTIFFNSIQSKQFILPWNGLPIIELYPFVSCVISGIYERKRCNVVIIYLLLVAIKLENGCKIILEDAEVVVKIDKFHLCFHIIIVVSTIQKFYQQEARSVLGSGF